MENRFMHDIPDILFEPIQLECGYFQGWIDSTQSMDCPHCGAMNSLFEIRLKKKGMGETVPGFACAECEREWFAVDPLLEMENAKGWEQGIPKWLRLQKRQTLDGQFVGVERVAIH